MKIPPQKNIGRGALPSKLDSPPDLGFLDPRSVGSSIIFVESFFTFSLGVTTVAHPISQEISW